MTKKKTSPPAKRKTKPPFEPTVGQRKTVHAMAGYGIPGTEIALALGIGYSTLKKYFRQELDIAHIEANAKVAETAFRLATSGKCPAATFFWLKTRAHWRETTRHEHTGAVGTYDLSKVSDADLNKLETILGPIADAAGNQGGEGEAGGGAAAAAG